MGRSNIVGKIRTSLLFCLLLSIGCSGENDEQPSVPAVSDVVKEETPPLHQQVILVTTSSWTSSQGQLRRFEWTTETGWEQVGSTAEALLGRAGLAWGIGLYDWSIKEGEIKKTEGDDRSPAGIFALKSSFGTARKEMVSWSLPYQSTHPNLHCVNDIGSKQYNKIVNQLKITRDWNQFELLRRDDGLYKWGIVIDHNSENIIHKGACMFLHSAPEQEATKGGTALSERAIAELLPWIDTQKQPILIQTSEEGLARLLSILGAKGVILPIQ